MVAPFMLVSFSKAPVRVASAQLGTVQIGASQSGIETGNAEVA